jgi:diguanylate cyclase (GGDEF)-like protein
LVAAAFFSERGVRGAGLAPLGDTLLFATVVVALGLYFVAIPGFAIGDPALAVVFVVDLGAVVLAALGAIARRAPCDRRIGWLFAAGAAAAAVGDGVASEGAAGQIASSPVIVALMWSIAGFLFAMAAETETPGAEAEVALPERVGGTPWLIVRVVLPLVGVLVFPATAAVLWAVNGPELGWAVFFSAFFLVALVLAFGRQAYLVTDNRRAMDRERELRREAVRRREELEALTGLATTMTQTLEEAPIVEQALSVLHLAARASSSALHAFEEDTLVLSASAGRWQSDHVWAKATGDDADLGVGLRGGHLVARFPLRARGHDIGVVTLVRSAADPFGEEELGLLRLLVDQLAVAVQNARDYRERLEQAVRDPLTGLYNRRFLFEALDKEVSRVERYGSTASLVLFDVDDFKQINDTLGHAAGDDVLRRLAEIVNELIRPVDSFARIGGEEFALLLPETAQLDALLVAERIRTAISRQKIIPDRRVTVSGGVATVPQDASTVDEIERAADQALYWAKRNGKDLCAVASEVVVAVEVGERDAMLAHLYALVAGIDAQHLHTRDHSENVAAYAVAMGQALGMERDRVVRLRRAALLHDVGKIAVPATILEKPAALTGEEYLRMQLHPAVGSEMLCHAGLVEEGGWVRHHHERLDGQGYPDGLAGDAIPWEARIIFVADAFEAMTSDRPYRAGREVDEAIEELRRCSGTQFEPEIVEALCRLVDRGELAVLALRGVVDSAA